MSVSAQSNQIITLPATTPYNVKVADSGKTLLVPTLAGAQIINLPTPSPGLRYKFVVLSPGAAIGNTSTITPPSGTVSGLLSNSNGYIQKNGDANVGITAAATMGDFIDINCDGNKWIVFGYSGAVGLA